MKDMKSMKNRRGAEPGILPFMLFMLFMVKTTYKDAEGGGEEEGELLKPTPAA